MAEEDSRSRVTITLGRTGQVVKRSSQLMDGSSVSYSQPSVGRKRSIRDRLGNYADHDVPLSKKRQVRDASRLGQFVSDDSDLDDVTLTKDDLRFKIMRKSSSQTSIQQKGGDLRDLLSRPAHSSTKILPTRQHMPVVRDTRDQLSEPRHARPQMSVLKNGDRQILTEYGDGRRKLPELTDSRHLMPDLESTKRLGQEPNGSSSFPQIRPSSSTKALPDMDSLRRSYSPWTLDNLRRSPDRLLGTSRGVSPPKRNDEPDRRPLPRSYDESRSSSFVKYLEHLNPLNPSMYAAKAAQTAVAAKKVLPPVTQLPSSAGLMQRPYVVDTIDAFLHSLGLDKYCINFKAEEVDMFALRQMGDSDLKDLGIPMGPRKKILLTLLSQSKRQL